MKQPKAEQRRALRVAHFFVMRDDCSSVLTALTRASVARARTITGRGKDGKLRIVRDDGTPGPFVVRARTLGGTPDHRPVDRGGSPDRRYVVHGAQPPREKDNGGLDGLTVKTSLLTSFVLRASCTLCAVRTKKAICTLTSICARTTACFSGARAHLPSALRIASLCVFARSLLMWWTQRALGPGGTPAVRASKSVKRDLWRWTTVGSSFE